MDGAVGIGGGVSWGAACWVVPHLDNCPSVREELPMGFKARRKVQGQELLRTLSQEELDLVAPLTQAEIKEALKKGHAEVVKAMKASQGRRRGRTAGVRFRG